MTTSSLSGQPPGPSLAARLSGLALAPPSDADRARAVLHLVDWIGCAAAGRRSPAGEALARAFGNQTCVIPAEHGPASAGPAQSRDLPPREAVPAPTAAVVGPVSAPHRFALQRARDDTRGDPARFAFLWGGLGNVLEMDDVDRRALLHPGPTVIPAALAAAGEADGDLLGGMIAGYEAVIRLGRAVGPGHYALWHNTGTCGPIGAATAAAVVFGLDGARAAHALALGASQAAGFWHTRHDPGSMGKQLHTAHAARAGLDAARLARAGFTGPLGILEGPQGFFAATCPGADPEAVLARAPERMIHAVSFKPWAACRHAHPAIDAALLLRARLGDRAPEAITVETYADAIRFCDNHRPTTPLEAKFSLQHAVAVVLVRGAPRLSDFEPPAIEAPALADMRARVRVIEGADLTARYPSHFAARLRAEADGSAITAEVADALGDPENPLDPAAIFAKARTLLAHGGVARADADSLLDLARSLPDRPEATADLLARLMEVLA